MHASKQKNSKGSDFAKILARSERSDKIVKCKCEDTGG